MLPGAKTKPRTILAESNAVPFSAPSMQRGVYTVATPSAPYCSRKELLPLSQNDSPSGLG